jgi:DNA-binding transcriptional ArsR family regulator
MKRHLTGDLQDFLKALGSETRQQLLLMFIRGEKMTVGKVADRAGLSQSTTSEHLTMLKRGGLLKAKRAGKEVVYEANFKQMRVALDELKVRLNCAEY